MFDFFVTDRFGKAAHRFVADDSFPTYSGEIARPDTR